MVMDNMGKSFGFKIISEVKKATNHLKQSVFDEGSSINVVHRPIHSPSDPDIKVTSIQDNKIGAAVEKALNLKADSQEVKELVYNKANKEDVQMTLRQIEILHKQIRQLSLLLTLKLKTSLDAPG